jgi:NTP pyrophosphatase (non-canonical NTP hydrolase)
MARASARVPVHTLTSYEHDAVALSESTLLSHLLGLGGEAGEVQEIFKKLMRNDGWREGDPIPEERRQRIKLELGDLLWYLAAVGHLCGFSLEEIANANLDKLYARRAEGTIAAYREDR